MKKLNVLVSTVALLAAFPSCKKDNAECELVAAKIIRYDCDRVIFQMLTPVNLGDSGWLDVQTGIRYDNVISYNNTCIISKLPLRKSDTLYVKVKKGNDAAIPASCVQCLAVSQNPPGTMVDFVEISGFPCREN